MIKINVAAPFIQGNEKKYVEECISSTWISSTGEFLKRFEVEFAAYCGAKHAIATNNGTTALHLALVALGIKHGDEVIVPTLTYIASPNAVYYCGAKPVLVDSELRTLNIDPSLIEAKINSRTKAIMVVHLYGHPVDMDPILTIANKYSIPVIEDAAEALGAEYKDKKIGTLGKCATFSFFGNKLISTGEGGMIVTDDDDLADKLRLYRNQGQDPDRRYWFPVVGYNYRMTNLAAAIGCAQLEKIDAMLHARRNLAVKYNQALKDLDHLIQPQIEEPWAKHSYWMYTILLKNADAQQRDEVMSFLANAGIETRPVFYPMHVLPPYKEASESYPIATTCAERGINLPTHMFVTDDNVEYIIETLSAALEQSKTSSFKQVIFG
jgi:perosamine synthetase